MDRLLLLSMETDFFDGTNSVVLVRKSGDTRLTRNTDFDFDDNPTGRLTITLNEATAGDFSEQPYAWFHELQIRSVE